MGKGGGGGQADQSGMIQAQASAQAATQAYALGMAQLQWAQQVWNQEQPLVNAAETTQMQAAQQSIAMEQMLAPFTQAQIDMWNQYYRPLDIQYINQAQQWGSPANIAQVTGQAQAGIAEQAQQGLNTAWNQLESYGVNPGAPRFASMGVGANVLSGAAQAAAGTTAAQNMKLQQLALEQGAINTGQGVANTAGQIANAASGATQATTGAASSAAGTAQSNLATGTSAQTAATNWYNTGANNMGVYTNAVNAYNNTNLGYAQLAAQQSAGLGSFAGGIIGDLLKPVSAGGTTVLGSLFANKGGPIEKFADGGVTGQYQPTPGLGRGPATFQQPQQGIPTTPPQHVPAQGTPGGQVPHHLSPSGGQQEDDVDAKLTAGEFVIPKDVSQWKGQEYWVKEIDKARMGAQQFATRQDIGGEPVSGIPNPNPSFISRPGMQQAVQPQMAMAAPPAGPRPSPTGINQTSGIPLPA
jgi:hypothetical protein